MKFDDFYSETRKQIDAKIEELIKGQGDEEKIRYALEKGKRLRPVLSTLVFRACEGKNEKSALESAVAAELMHCASLVHDDIIDRDQIRREKTAAHEKYGVDEAILLGHSLVSQGLNTIVNHGAAIVKTFLQVWSTSLRGETLDVKVMKQTLDRVQAPAMAVYYDVILKKTASLFAGAAQIGAQEAEASEEAQKLFWQYGEKVGLAYQLADDYVEMKEKRKFETLPLLLVATLEQNAKETFIKLIEEGKISPIEFLTKLNFDAKTFYEKEIHDRVREAEDLVEQIHQLKPLPIQYKELLGEAPQWVVNQMLLTVTES